MGYTDLEFMVEMEIIQKREEGCDVRAIEEEFTWQRVRPSQEAFDSIYRRLEALTPRADFPYVEPSDLEGIRRGRPPGPRKIDVRMEDDLLYDKIYGAWLGRCIGCLLGKPVEGWTRRDIASYLRLADAYPLNSYIPEVSPPPEGYAFRPGRWEDTALGKIRGMPRDDDIDYTILNLHILEERGLNFTTEVVGDEWLTHLPYLLLYTAERIAYRNLVNGLTPPTTATHRNPYREWIGAQIRADAWGYACPGMSERAAELAYRDASLSHVKNGIYGEMLISAIVSAAFTTSDVRRVIEVGLSEIPAESRLAEAIGEVMVWSKELRDWEETWERIMEGHAYHRVHTINNAALVVMGLLYGGGDFEKAITTTVMGGLDTDCNGATVGSIMGAITGAKAIPKKWKEPLNNRVKSIVAGFNDSQISDLARQTLLVAKRCLSAPSSGPI